MYHPKSDQVFTLVPQLRFWLFATSFLLLVLPLKARADAATSARGREEAAAKVQRVIDNLRERLEIASPVEAAVVPQNALAFSVEPPAQPGGAFRLSIEEAYLELLSEDELEAALAHELGHVWIFTHHPFLQTELLANRIAMKAAARDSLARVYEKLWKRIGAKGDLVQFLGR